MTGSAAFLASLRFCSIDTNLFHFAVIPKGESKPQFFEGDDHGALWFKGRCWFSIDAFDVGQRAVHRNPAIRLASKHLEHASLARASKTLDPVSSRTLTQKPNDR